MNVDTFLEQFGHLADAPDGIKKLRELILQLAVRGRIVENNSTQSAIDLVNEMRRDKKRRIENGEIRKSTQLPPVALVDQPFSLPQKWAWIRIGDGLNLINGKAFKSSEWSDTGLPIIRIQNLNDPQKPFNYCDIEVDDKFHVQNGNILISWSGTPGTSFGAFIWNRGPALLNQHIFRAELFGSENFNEYLKLAINSQLDAMIAEAQGGVGLRHITKGKLELMCLPLPPSDIQKRIVAKVDELMALCDELETQQQQRQTVHARLTTASLRQLTTAETPRQLTKAWQRIDTQFDQLFTTRESIEILRQTILQLAVQGKLVEQDPEDEPAEALVSKIGLKKESKHDISGSDLKGQIQPHSIPSTWVWSNFNELGELSRGKSRHRPRNAPHLYENGIYPLVQTGDVARSNGRIKTYSNKYNEAGLEQSRLWKKGTLCITIAANIADTGILDFDACIPDSVVGFVPHELFENARSGFITY